MPRLRLVDGRSDDYIELPRHLIVEVAVDAQALADELDEDLQDAYDRVWRGDRAKALIAISGLQLSARSLRASFHALAGIAEAAPACADGLALPGHGRAA